MALLVPSFFKKVENTKFIVIYGVAATVWAMSPPNSSFASIYPIAVKQRMPIFTDKSKGFDVFTNVVDIPAIRLKDKVYRIHKRVNVFETGCCFSSAELTTTSIRFGRPINANLGVQKGQAEQYAYRVGDCEDGGQD